MSRTLALLLLIACFIAIAVGDVTDQPNLAGLTLLVCLFLILLVEGLIEGMRK